MSANTTSASVLPYYLSQYWIDAQDKRTVGYPLVGVQPWTFAAIMYVYYALVTKIGPAWMKHRPAYQLRKTMFCYNLLMVMINAFFFYEAIRRSDYFRRLFMFDYPDASDNSPETLWEIHLGYYYWITKFIDLFDTFFYVLRKKDATHVNFLHLYHHISVPFFGYCFLKINPMMPCCMLFIIMNSFVHSAMYSYYALAALGPRIQPYLWWKRYITVMQLSQFAIGAAYGCLVLMFQRNYPAFWLYVGITQPPFFFWMFYQFYKQAYGHKNKPARMNDTCAAKQD